MARRNVSLFTPANRLEPLARKAVLCLGPRPFLAPVVRRLLNSGRERL